MRKLWLLAIAAALSPSVARSAEPDAKGVEFFEAKIRPVLVEQCFSCHSDEAQNKKKLKGGLKLDSALAVQQGGDSGKMLTPGKPAESLLIKALKGDTVSQMPPKGKLPDSVIADFETWVKLGAPDPRTTTAKSTVASTIDIEKGRQHWAFQPPRKAEPPRNSSAATPLDAFILAQLKDKGLSPVQQADKQTLIRRVYFDLTGLPPTSEEVEAFLKDNSADAYAKLVDKLLASPRYGERWARHWLDVARYAEDQAHTFGVKPKSNAYRYRDWVIQALNADMPYDRFVKLQIAGDLVPESEGDPFTRLAGLGLLGLGAEYYKGSPTALADELDDKVDTVTRGLLGLTVSCARCHDHKYDPIPTGDYYSLAGVFNGSQLSDAPLAPAAEVKRYDDAQSKIKEQDDKVKSWLADKSRAAGEAESQKAAKYLTTARTCKSTDVDKVAASEKLDPRFLRQWVKYLDPKNAGKLMPALKGFPNAKPEDVTKFTSEFQTKLQAAIAAKTKPSKEQAELLKGLFQDPNAPFALPAADAEKGLAKADAEKLTSMRADLDKLKSAAPAMYPVAHVIKGGGQQMQVFIRGNPAKPGETAPKGFLKVLTPKTAAPVKDYTRLDLANAIASRENPITARVIVNRVWAQHFGRGLVATPSNFGTLGDKPSHPELLDWLTVRFIENGWSLKWLHREIMLSSTYRQSSKSTTANQEKDADNVSLWRANRRRLEVEAWRDALLSVSGRLDTTTGGPTTDLRNATNTRRTVYGKVSRHELDGLLRLFDFPDANVTADKRTLTTVPQQQLFVLNSEFFIAQAKAFAARVQKSSDSNPKRIESAYKLAYGRAPTREETALGLAFLELPAVSEDKLTKWEQYSQALLAANEFLYVD